MRFLQRLAAGCCAVLLSGCQRNSVTVVDAGKKPIADAKVEPITLSMNLGVQLTDRSGIVKLPGTLHTIQKIEWVSVTKDGYQPSGHVPVSPDGQTIIILKPAK